MPASRAGRLNPRHWTALTWLAVLLWSERPIVQNIPPSRAYAVDPITGALAELVTYKSLSEYPFPVGWPLHYVEPSPLGAVVFPTPLPAAAPLPVPPASVHPWAMVANLLLVLAAIAALVYVLQKTTYRYSLRLLFGVMSLIPLHFALARLAGALAGHDAGWWYGLIVYFLPIPAALAVQFSLAVRLKQLPWHRAWPHRPRASEAASNPEDAIAEALRLEMQGDWAAAIGRYRAAAQRWPEHADYVQHCVERIRAKQTLARA